MEEERKRDSKTSWQSVKKQVEDISSGQVRPMVSLDALLKFLATAIFSFMVWFSYQIYQKIEAHDILLQDHKVQFAVMSERDKAEKESRDELKADVKEIKAAIEKLVKEGVGK